MKRLVYYIRRHKHLRRFCKLLLNLSILSLLGFLVWFGILLFTGQWTYNPVIGALVFVVALTGFIWLSKVGLESNWQPSMKITAMSLVCLFFITAFAGVQPLADYKDAVIERVRGIPSALPSGYDVVILPGQMNGAKGWAISLNGGGWKEGTLTIEVTITNLGDRRCFGYFCSGLYPGPDLIAIDSTGKLVEPWVRDPEISKGELWVVHPYAKEFYPNESWTGTLKFELSKYSGETKLYLGYQDSYHWYRKYLLFDLGEPKK